MQPGKYRAKATAWGLGETSSGKPEIAIEFGFTSLDLAGQSITWHGYLSEAAFNRTVESLRHCGWKGDDFSDLEGLGANEVELVVEEEEYEGKVHAKVRWVNRAGGLSIKAPMTGDKVKAFAASMRGKVRAFDAKKGKREPASTSGQERAEASMTDEDIPF